jgi:DNA-binding response OmpR family regulator
MFEHEKIRILCVEDDRDTCEVISLILGKENYEVVHANSIAEGLEAIRRDGFKLFILDQKFPDGSGLELCKKIREFNRETPILFHTAAAEESDIDAARAAGANGYLIKPRSWDQLPEVVDLLVKQKNGSFVLF